MLIENRFGGVQRIVHMSQLADLAALGIYDRITRANFPDVDGEILAWMRVRAAGVQRSVLLAQRDQTPAIHGQLTERIRETHRVQVEALKYLGIIGDQDVPFREKPKYNPVDLQLLAFALEHGMALLIDENVIPMLATFPPAAIQSLKNMATSAGREGR